MIDELEARIRAASPVPPVDLDVAKLHERASSRRRTQRRRASLVTVVLLALVVAVLVPLLAFREDEQQPARRVDAGASEVTWQRVPGIEGRVSDVVTADGLSVAVGWSGTLQHATVWTSANGVTWTEVYSSPPSQVELCSGKTCIPQDAQSNLLQVTHAAGRFVAVGSVDGPGAVQRGVAMTSTDGTTWVEASPGAFDPVRPPDSNLGTMLRGLAWFRGGFVVTGDVYTANKRQIGGLSPAIWRSRDGVNWSRRILDLGDGFDPYMTELTVKGDLLVAGGGYRHGFGAWTTRDLEHWSFHMIERHGASHVVAVPGGFVAAGQRCLPAKVCGQPRAKARLRARPTLWFSPDAEHWRVVLELPAGDSTGTSFGPIGVVGDTLVALGTRSTGGTVTKTTPLVYLSSDGQTWSKADDTLFPESTTFSGSGSRGTSFLAFGFRLEQWIASP
jgi:hypothetical protein